MRGQLWPDGAENHAAEIDLFFSGQGKEPLAVLVAEEQGTLLGFAELSIRPYAEKCATQQVAYLEGWYVAPGMRGRGIGRALLEAGEAWGRSRYCREFASDAEANNDASIAAHLACGFEDAGMVRCFRKDL